MTITSTNAASIPTRADNVETAPRLSEDWLSLIIGIAIFVLALGPLVGTDIIGWVVSTSVVERYRRRT